MLNYLLNGTTQSTRAALVEVFRVWGGDLKPVLRDGLAGARLIEFSFRLPAKVSGVLMAIGGGICGASLRASVHAALPSSMLMALLFPERCC